MEHFNFRYVKTGALITLIAILALALFAANKAISAHWGISFSVFAVLGFLFGIINHWLWNVPPCAWMYNVPNFKGRYEGTLKYEYRNENCETTTGTMEHIKVVNQNGSCVVVKSFTKKDGILSSESVSKEVSVIKEPDGTYSLLINYLNEGNSELGFPPHYGTEVLKFIDEGKNKSKYLVGRYYTERLPFGTKGKIDLTYKNKNLHHEK